MHPLADAPLSQKGWEMQDRFERISPFECALTVAPQKGFSGPSTLYDFQNNAD